MMAPEALAVAEAYAHLSPRSAKDLAADFQAFFELLQKWQRVQNLVSRETLSTAWTRHFRDSLELLPLLRASDRMLLDLGSGGGFPAIPVAIATKGTSLRITLVEPNQRKVSFLRTAIRTLGLSAEVMPHRAEELDPRMIAGIDVITSRAMASLTDLCGAALPFFGPNTRALFHKGREYVEELAESRAVWDYDVVVRPNATAQGSAILELTHLAKRS